MTFQAFEQFYSSLKGEFEGYIKLSDSQDFIILSHLVKAPALPTNADSNLPQWQSLHHGRNFIYELCLFEPSLRRSIQVRQVNDDFKLLDCCLDDVGGHIQSIEFLAHPRAAQVGKIKITQVWEERQDEFCHNFPVLSPTKLLFSGFSPIQNLANPTQPTNPTQGGVNE